MSGTQWPRPIDPRVALLHMQAIADLLDEWDADSENDNYSMGDAADDVRARLRATCICPTLPHDRRCPRREGRFVGRAS